MLSQLLSSHGSIYFEMNNRFLDDILLKLIIDIEETLFIFIKLHTRENLDATKTQKRIINDE